MRVLNYKKLQIIVLTLAVVPTGCVGALKAQLGRGGEPTQPPATKRPPPTTAPTPDRVDPSQTSAEAQRAPTQSPAASSPAQEQIQPEVDPEELKRQREAAREQLAKAYASTVPAKQIKLLAEANAETGAFAAFGIGNLTVDKIRDDHGSMAAIDPFAADCRAGKYDELKGWKPVMGWEYTYQLHGESLIPATACELALRAPELVPKVVTDGIAKILADHKKSFDYTIRLARSGESMHENRLDRMAHWKAEVDKVKSSLAPLYDGAGIQPGATDFSYLDSIGDEWKKAAESSAANNKMSSYENHPDAGVKRSVADLIGPTKHKLIAVRVTSRAWNIFRSYGVPSYRTKEGQLLLRVKGESFCRMYPFTASQDYSGGGRWQRHITSSAGAPRIASCK